MERLKVLISLNAIYSHRNLDFIGPAGTGKTHLAQAFGYACCQHGLKTYFIKASEPRGRYHETDSQQLGVPGKPIPVSMTCA